MIIYYLKLEYIFTIVNIMHINICIYRFGMNDCNCIYTHINKKL